MTSQGSNNFQLFNLGKITRNYYTPVTCDHVISVIELIERQSERHIIMAVIYCTLDRKRKLQIFENSSG